MLRTSIFGRTVAAKSAVATHANKRIRKILIAGAIETAEAASERAALQG